MSQIIKEIKRKIINNDNVLLVFLDEENYELFHNNDSLKSFIKEQLLLVMTEFQLQSFNIVSISIDLDKSNIIKYLSGFDSFPCAITFEDEELKQVIPLLSDLTMFNSPS